MRTLTFLLCLALVIFTSCAPHSVEYDRAYQEGLEAGKRQAQKEQELKFLQNKVQNLEQQIQQFKQKQSPATSQSKQTQTQQQYVKLGDSPSRVLSLVGAPDIHRASDDYEIWFYYVSDQKIYMLLFYKDRLWKQIVDTKQNWLNYFRSLQRY